MLQQENQTQSANFEWVCQALSAIGEPCDTSALEPSLMRCEEAWDRSSREEEAVSCGELEAVRCGSHEVLANL